VRVAAADPKTRFLAHPLTRVILTAWLTQYRVAMYEIVLTLTDETASALSLSLDAMGEEIKLAAAVKLFELGRLSSGAAAGLAGMPRTLFLTKLSDYGVNTFDLNEALLAEDLANA